MAGCRPSDHWLALVSPFALYRYALVIVTNGRLRLYTRTVDVLGHQADVRVATIEAVESGHGMSRKRFREPGSGLTWDRCVFIAVRRPLVGKSWPAD